MLMYLQPYRDWIGYLAGGLVTLAFVPQVFKTLKEGDAKGISLVMYVLFCGGVGLWLIYGLLMWSWPIIASNVVTLILSGAVLALKVKHSWRK